MKRLFIILLVLVSGLCFSKEVCAKVKVVTSTLDMADFVKEVGKNKVEVYAISRGKVDLHFFEPRPSQVMKLNRADMLVIGGLDVDIWIKSMIDAARNPKIRFGSSGYVDPSDGICPVQIPRGRIDGSMGDVHPYGNPHFWFTPENVKIAVENICEGLCRVSPSDCEYFERNRDEYIEKANRTFEELRASMSPYAGAKVIQYHQSWDYFCETFDLEIVACLEPKPGISPSVSHLKKLVEQARREDVKLLFVEPYYPEKPVGFVSKELKIEALRLPLYLGSKEGIGNYLENLKYSVERIVEILSKD